MLCLKITDDQDHLVEVSFMREEITIGRKEGNTIRLLERNISRYHAILTHVAQSVFIEDLDSYNGVILNGNRISRKTTLYPNDIVQIGDYEIVLDEASEVERPKIDIDAESLEFAAEQLQAGFDEPQPGYNPVDNQSVKTNPVIETELPGTSIPRPKPAETLDVNEQETMIFKAVSAPEVKEEVEKKTPNEATIEDEKDDKNKEALETKEALPSKEDIVGFAPLKDPLRIVKAS